MNQEEVAGLAYRIKDTGAAGGIVVSPLGLQQGATLVAKHEGIKHVHLDPKSTTTEYILRYLNQVFVGVSDRLSLKDCLTLVITRPDGSTETRTAS